MFVISNNLTNTTPQDLKKTFVYKSLIEGEDFANTNPPRALVVDHSKMVVLFVYSLFTVAPINLCFCVMSLFCLQFCVSFLVLQSSGCRRAS